MKIFFSILIGGLFLFTACEKVKTYGSLPDRAGTAETDSVKALRAWVEQVAIQKKDSMRRVDSMMNSGGKVDTNSLFHKKNMMVAIVEVNNHYFPNVNCYVDEKGKPVFDLAFPFSANINMSTGTGRAYVSYNPQHQAMIRLGVFNKVKNAGIKIGLSILGNWDEAGWSNFRNLEEATDFAQLVAIEVRKHGFEAVFADDEYSSFRSGADPNSYVMAMSEIKRLLPDIYLCFYIWAGKGGGTYNGKQMGDIADALFTASYPEYARNVYGAPNSKTFSSCSEASNNITGGGFSDVPGTVARSKAEGRGGIMFYNIRGKSNSPAFYAPYVRELKGLTLTVAPGCLNPDESDFVNGR